MSILNLKKMTDKIGVVVTLTVLFLADLCLSVGILIHGKANFPELLKHLKGG